MLRIEIQDPREAQQSLGLRGAAVDGDGPQGNGLEDDELDDGELDDGELDDDEELGGGFGA